MYVFVFLLEVCCRRMLYIFTSIRHRCTCIATRMWLSNWSMRNAETCWINVPAMDLFHTVVLFFVLISFVSLCYTRQLYSLAVKTVVVGSDVNAKCLLRLMRCELDLVGAMSENFDSSSEFVGDLLRTGIRCYAGLLRADLISSAVSKLVSCMQLNRATLSLVTAFFFCLP